MSQNVQKPTAPPASTNRRVVKVRAGDHEDLTHVLKACYDLQNYDEIEYKALGKALYSLEVYKQRFLQFELGTIKHERSTRDYINNGLQSRSFMLVANKAKSEY